MLNKIGGVRMPHMPERVHAVLLQSVQTPQVRDNLVQKGTGNIASTPARFAEIIS